MTVTPQKASKSKPESVPHKLSRLQSRTALYDSILQSISSLRSLPGAARDATFVAELESQEGYFRALRCLNIGYSHSVLRREREALALFARAEEHGRGVEREDLGRGQGPAGVATLAASPTQLGALQTQLTRQVLRQQGLVTLRLTIPPLFPATSLRKQEDLYAHKDGAKRAPPPLVENLHVYPEPSRGVVDLGNLVQYPPCLEPVPMKPIFLDLAYNFIEYPARKREGDVGRGQAEGAAGRGEGATEKKRGWFGFGR